MTLTKNIVCALAAGGLVISALAPASAQNYNGQKNGNNHGYSNQGKHSHSGKNYNGQGYKGHNQNNNYKGKGYNNNGKPYNGGHHSNNKSNYGHNQNGYYPGNKHTDNRGHKNNGYNGKSYNNNHGYNHKSYNSHGNNGHGYNNNHTYNGHNHSQKHYKPRYAYNPNKRVIYAHQFPRYYKYPTRYVPRYSIGHRVYRGGYTYVINDYWSYGLYAPPPRYQWVRCDGDAYLAGIGTGLISGIIIGAMLGY